MIKLGDILVCSTEEGERENEIRFICSVVRYSEDKAGGGGEDRIDEYEGIVVNEEKAKASPCYRIDGTNLVFSKGIVGALSREQVEKYCPKIISKPPSADVICVHLDDFDELVKAVEERLRRRE